MTTPADAHQALNEILDRLGVASGDVILVHSDMGGIPLPTIPASLSRDSIQQQREAWCDFLYRALADRLGTDGTLVVPTFSYSTTAPGGAFELETTPSEVGPFSEFVRRHPNAARSLHPVFSLAAVGPRAADLMSHCGRAAFGHESPWQRLSEVNARIVTLGLPFNAPTTYVHHVEQCFGVPHRFHKTLEMPVCAGGKQVGGYFVAYLRFRNVDVGPNLVPLENALRLRGFLAEADWNGNWSSAVRMQDFDKVAYAMLKDDPWAFATRRVIMRVNDVVPANGPVQDDTVNFDLILKPPETAKE